MTEQSTEIDRDALRQRLTPLQWHVTQEAGTEQAFTGTYWDSKTPGLYRCVVCDAPLFRSDAKYESGTGWPSFWEPVSPDAVVTKTDTSFGMIRTEAECARCGAHLGHVFEDGPRQTTGLRYCMNSASLALRPEPDGDGKDGEDGADAG